MLDIFYATRELFTRDCVLCSLDADALLTSGEYVVLPDGGIIASSIL
jgi:hypothetical protein